MICRSCKAKIKDIFVDLKIAPVSNAYVTKNNLDKREEYFPLRTLTCRKCWLVQTEDFVDSKRIFNKEYIYFSSFSKTLVEQSELYVNKMISQYNINKKNMVAEIAANDGYLLQFFKKKKIPCYGIDPSKKAALQAKKKGIPMIIDFFNTKISKKLKRKNMEADFIIANNVLAHVPNINDFVKGIKILLKNKGVASIEFQHLYQLINKSAFDAIYHEHFSYISLIAADNLFKRNGMVIFDVHEIGAQNGSLRIFVKNKSNKDIKIKKNVKKIINKEKKLGLNKVNRFKKFQANIEKIKDNFIKFLINAKLQNKIVAGYGAAAKGNTLINFSGVKTDLIKFVVDLNTEKQGKYLPGSHIPIVDEKELKKIKPDYVIILPWNLKSEIVKQLNYVKKWGCKFVIAVPKLKIFK